MQSVSNVGPVTAAAFVAAIHEASRFRRGHEVEAYRGLVPRQLSSGETQRRGRITKAGSSRVRWLLIQAPSHAPASRSPDGDTARVGGSPPSAAARVSLWSCSRPARGDPLRALARWHRVRAASTPCLPRCAGRASLTESELLPRFCLCRDVEDPRANLAAQHIGRLERPLPRRIVQGQR